MGRRWGIVGTGKIAARFAEAIVAEGGEVVAVSSGSEQRATAFAAEHAVPRAYGRHEALAEDPEVEVVYVATTNDRHHLDARSAIEAGLPVLVEKPFALDLARGAELATLARDRGVFAAEAMWMRVQPAFVELERRIAAGDVGEPRLVQADFGIAATVDPDRRWFNRALGGGALLDVGVYPLTFVVSVLGAPTEVAALGELTDTAVDAQVAAAMRHPGGALSSWSCSFVADTGVEATVAGSEGSLRVHGPFHHSPRLSRRVRDRVVEEVTVADHDLGYRHEVREVERCLDAGATSSDRLPLELSLEVLAVLDELRTRIGVVHP